MKKYILIGIAILGGFFLLSVFLSFVFAENQGNILQNEARKLELRPAFDPERGEVEEVRVPPSRVPSDYQERLQAAAITLLPNHLAAPEARSQVEMSPQEEREIFSLVERFLRSWETYLPGQKSWEKTWKDLVVFERQGQIAARLDSTDAPGVCPAGSCQVGSSWEGGEPAIFPVDADDKHLYITAYGALRYLGNSQINPYAGGSTERSYGIILVPKGNSWLVERVAAESLR